MDAEDPKGRQPENTDHPFSAHEWHGADLDGHPCAGGRDEYAGRIVVNPESSRMSFRGLPRCR
jgi:hypothetical protein